MKKKKKTGHDDSADLRKRAEEMLQQSELRYRALFENMQEGFAYCRMLYDEQERPVDFVYLDVNRAFELLTGLKNVVGKPVSEVIPGIKESSPELFESYGRVASTGMHERFEFDLKSLRQWLSISVYSPERGYFVAVFENITGRKRAEEALRESEEEYRNLVERANDGIVIVQDGIVKYINARLAEMRGVTVEEVIGTPFTDHIYPDELPEVVDRYKQRMAGKDISPIYETALRRRDGSKIHAELNAGIVTYQGKPADLVIIRDITERKRAEEALRESEEKFRGIFENVLDVYYETAIDGTILEVSPSIEIVSKGQYHRDDLIGKSMNDFYSEPGMRQTLLEALQERGNVTDYEIKLKNRDNLIIPCSISSKIRFDAQGRPEKILGTIRDITERKRTEEEIRRKAKDLQEKNEELTRFIYAVSHDLRSPLVTIQTFQRYLELDIRSQDAARVEKDLGYIRNAAGKMGRLLNELLRFSRVGRIMNPSEEAPLQAIVKEALDLVAGRITGRGVRIDLTEEPVVLHGDRTRLVEVFLNLVDNAVKFMGDELAPRVEIGVEQAGEELVLHVRDNGIGIDPQLQPMLFGLFHKLDPETEGEGIGLALVKQIVELHGGRIWVESAGIGMGATFRFTLAKTRRKRGREETP